MTDAELNEAISIARGWKKHPAWTRDWPLKNAPLWESPDPSIALQNNPPNFIGGDK